MLKLVLVIHVPSTKLGQKMSSALDLNTRHYLRNLAKCDNSFFLTPWGGVILRNSDEDGDLVQHSTTQSFIQSKLPFWIYLILKIFRDDQGIFGTFLCPNCQSMSSLSMMTMDQSRGAIEQLLCLHSVAAAERTGDWRDIWGLPHIEIGILSHRFQPGLDTKVLPLIEGDLFLAAVQNRGDVKLIFTLSKKNKSPFCSRCSKQKCKHYTQYKEHKDDENVSGNESNNSNESEGTDNAAGTSEVVPPSDHYAEIEPIDEYNKNFGYNLTPIVYPFKMDPESQESWIQRLDGHYILPEKIIPEFIEGFACKHGQTFDSNDENLLQFSSNIIIYTETSEKVYSIKTFSRKTLSGCKCKQQADTHKLLLWHIGKGKMIDYLFLSGYMHSMRSNGTPKNGLFRSRCERMNSIGVQTTLTQKDLTRATNGFISKISFHEELNTFSCPKCGNNPKYLVADGKSDGPTKRKVEHLKEMGPAENDNVCLPQGSFYKNRVFFHEYKERQAICGLLSGAQSMDDFLLEEDEVLLTGNARIVSTLLTRIARTWQNEMPVEYTRFLSNVCKQSSVSGLLQVTSSLPLNYLRLFCEETLDIRSVEEVDKLEFLQQQLPAFWPMLTDILDLEGSKYLPADVQPIVLRLLEIRTNIFLNAADRANGDYEDWISPGEEHPTQFYPEFPIFRYPKLYTVSGQKDVDLCNKAFAEKRDFSYGVFSIGCCCDLNVTYGFELMLSQESAHNFFRFLMCRDVDMNCLEGVIFDHACGLDAYILNREPREFQFLRCLVDGSHWNGQKKLKRPDKSGKGGHLGCSEGFNFNIYKVIYFHICL